MGVTLQLKEKFNEALDSFKKALELKPKNLGTINHIAECYERIKSFDDAKNILIHTWEPTPKDVSTF